MKQRKEKEERKKISPSVLHGGCKLKSDFYNFLMIKITAAANTYWGLTMYSALLSEFHTLSFNTHIIRVGWTLSLAPSYKEAKRHREVKQPLDKSTICLCSFGTKGFQIPQCLEERLCQLKALERITREGLPTWPQCWGTDSSPNGAGKHSMGRKRRPKINTS